MSSSQGRSGFGNADRSAEILRLDDLRLEAMTKPDLTALADLLADDVLYIHSSGISESKVEFLASLATGRLKCRSFRRMPPRISWLGMDVVLLTGQISIDIEVDSGARTLQSVFTANWVKRSGAAWRLAVWQSTLLASPKP